MIPEYRSISNSVVRIAGTLACTILCLPLGANPSGKDPSRPLAAHGTIEGAEELVTQLYGVFDEESKFVDETYARKDKPTGFSDRKIATSAGRLWKARRDAERLQIMGEPAGYDLLSKLQPLMSQVNQFAQAYRGTPEGNQLAQRIMAKLHREKPQMQRFLEQAEAALQQGKLEIFEREMEKRGQELNEQLVFFNSSESKPISEAFNAMLSRGDSELATKRKRDYAQQAAVAIDQQRSAFGRFVEQAKRVPREIAEEATAQLGEGTHGGPVEAFLYIGAQWGATSTALLRANAIQWAFPLAKPSTSGDLSALEQLALRSLASVIEAASRSTAPSDVAGVYGGMLEAISVLERRNGIMSTDVNRACAAAMATLAAKDPALPQRVAAYERATSEVLRWRQSYAFEQATHLGRNSPRGSAVLMVNCDPQFSVRPPYASRPARDRVAASSVFTEPAQWMVQASAACLVGKPVIVDRVVRLSPSSRVAVIPYRESYYANLPVPLPSDAEVADLRAALVVDEDHAPLTLAAADAVSSAMMQDYESVMGRIETVFLESIVTRMIVLPDGAYPLVNLGNSVAINETTPAVLQTCWRLELQPLWARNRYFIVRLTSEVK